MSISVREAPVMDQICEPFQECIVLTGKVDVPVFNN